MRILTAVLWITLASFSATPAIGAETEVPNLAPNSDLERADGGQPAFWSQRTPTDPKRTLTWDARVAYSGTGAAWYDDLVLHGTAAKPSAESAIPSLTCGAEDFELLEGFVPKQYGRVEVVFPGESARYDVTVSCLDRPDAGCSLKLLAGGQQVAQWTLDDTKDIGEGRRDKLIGGVDIQRRSRITLDAEAHGARRCRIRKITFVPVGRFQGELVPDEKLRVAPSLRIYEGFDQRPAARAMLTDFINRGIAEAEEKHEAELAALESPDDWRSRQQETRARLEESFGFFGPKSPLNARIVGKLDRPDYVIEKLIFESQPGYHLTANFYVPKRRELPRPGVLFTCGHATDGKANHLYHDCCLGLVLKGYVVLALDPTGQGERAEYFDPDSGAPVVPLCVSHHHYLARPSWLVGRSLAGYRTWDCTRAIDYLVTRPEVDPEKVAVVGNSGGGIMALLITAFDQRVKVCAAAHPGGSMEQTFLTGRRIPQAEILSLIPPRPCLMVVGRDSGEEANHRSKMEGMLPFYEGLGVETDRCQMVLVDGVHNMEQPKREPCYGWLNQWFDHEEEGSEEPPLETETVEALRCTATGFSLRDLGGESGQTLNAKAAHRLRPPRSIPSGRLTLESHRAQVKAAIARRIGLKLPEDRQPPKCAVRGSFEGDGFRATKLLIESEEGIVLPSLMLRPDDAKPNLPAVLFVSELGKPTSADRPSLAIDLVRTGFRVLAVDVRGSGETDPRVRPFLSPVTQYDSQQFRFDTCAVEAAQLGTTMLAMRAYDVVRAMDYLDDCGDLSGRPVAVVGEGLGGVWSLAAAAFNPRPAGVVCVGTVPSYKLIVESQYYAVRDYYWVSGALKDFDLPDLAGLVAPRAAVLVDPADAMLQPLEPERCREICRWPQGVYGLLKEPKRLRMVQTADGSPEQIARQVADALENIGS